MDLLYCNNCGKVGHILNQCKMPITSIGIIAFRKNKNNYEYLMIRRKETLGFIDFMRGKYFIQNKDYIFDMIKQMTKDEKDRLLAEEFETLWENIWKDSFSQQFKSEEMSSKEKFNNLKNGITFKGNTYNLKSLIEESNKYEEWLEPEWGYPKGRRNNYEKDFDCALREWCEETGFNKNHLHNVQNLMPLYEIFTGSNFKSYKHKYFLMYMDMKNTYNLNDFQKSEVSKMGWFNLEECKKIIRPYNLEKINIIENVDKILKNYKLFIV